MEIAIAKLLNKTKKKLRRPTDIIRKDSQTSDCNIVLDRDILYELFDKFFIMDRDIAH